MTVGGWQLVEVGSQLLERDEREAVLGDLVEAGENAWQALLDVFGLVIRREAVVWKSWQPWFAAFGVSLPSSFFLMGFSLSVSLTFRQIIAAKIFEAGQTVGTGLLLLLCHVFLLSGWSWTGGFVVGPLSRRTLWVSIAFVWLPLFVLPDEVPRGIAVEVLLASFSSACDLGSSPRPANYANQAELSHCSSSGNDDVDYPRVARPRSALVEPALVDQLDARLACVVLGRDGTEGWPRGRPRLN